MSNVTVTFKEIGFPRSQASTTVEMNSFPSSGLSRGARWYEIDVSELPVCFIFKRKAVQEDGAIGS